jgi:hypothetical protein
MAGNVDRTCLAHVGVVSENSQKICNISGLSPLLYNVDLYEQAVADVKGIVCVLTYNQDAFDAAFTANHRL